MNTTNTQNIAVNQETNPKISFFKKFFIALLILFGIVYFWYIHSKSKLEITTLELFLTTNKDLTKQDVSIDSVDMGIDGTTINRFTLYNSVSYISPYAISSREININSGLNSNKDLKHFTFGNVTFKDVVINYDIGNNKKVNLYEILDNITASISPGADFSPLKILNSANKPTQNLNYSGITFYLGQVILDKPTVYIYQNQKLINTKGLDNIVINYNNVRQPMSYGEALLAGSLQFIDILDHAVHKP